MKTIRIFFSRYEKWLTPIALLGGFIIDSFTLRRADLLIENLLLSLYFMLLLGGIILLHKLQTVPQRSVRMLEFESILFLAIQFIFGGLFSALTVFYIKSASFFASWPFLIVLFGGMIATEYFKKHFSQFLVQLGTLYLLLFTYMIVVIPLMTRSMGEWMFVLSGVASVVIIGGYLFVFKKIVPYLFKKKEKKIAAVIASIFVLMNVFYFTNVIPPIPLALRESGVYRQVTRTTTGYDFSNFQDRFSFRYLKPEYTVAPGQPVYFFSSVFAPVRFTQDIVHEWQKKNASDKWVVVSSVRFPIYGGSDSGYRGYSVSQKVTPGEWRVLVKTGRGQVLGGESFVVR